MAIKYYQVSGGATAIRTVSYHFVCEYCGKDSGELKKKLKGLSHMNASNVTLESDNTHVGAHVSKSDLENHHEIANNEVEFLVREFYENVKRGYYPFSDKCPHCSRHQSWGNRYLYFYGGRDWFEIILLTIGWAFIWGLVAFFAIFFIEKAVQNGFKSIFDFSGKINLGLTIWQWIGYSYLIGLLGTPFITFCGYIIHKIQTVGSKERRSPIIATQAVVAKERRKKITIFK